MNNLIEENGEVTPVNRTITIGDKVIPVDAKRRYPATYLQTPEAWTKVAHYAGLGLKERQIADCIGVSPEAFKRNMAKIDELEYAYRAGLSDSLADVTTELFRLIKAGSYAAIVFFLKNRDPENWTERQEVEHKGAPVSFKLVIDEDKNE